MSVAKNAFFEASLLLLVLALLVLLPHVPVRPVAALPEGIYDSIPPLLPGYYYGSSRVRSWSYEARQTSEFGDYIGFAGTDRRLIAVTVEMVDWACESGDWYGGTGPCITTLGATWSHEITLNLYNVADFPGGLPIPGNSLPFATKTITFNIPFRPSENATGCPGTHMFYDSAAARCYNGYAFNIVFDFTGDDLILPDQIIFGIAYNTQHYGYDPEDSSGPYNSLNLGLYDYSAFDDPLKVGTDVEENALFAYSAQPGAYGGGYGDGGPANVFRRTTGWWPYTPTVCFSVPSAVCAGLLGFAVSPVGGVVTPINTFAVVAPWLAAVAVVGGMVALLVIVKKRRP